MKFGDPITLDQLLPADILCALRAGGLYMHYGVWLGSGLVLDFSGETRKDASNARIRIVTYEQFSEGCAVKFAGHGTGTAEDVRRRAGELSERIQYNLLNSNCEHLARYAATGQPEQWRSTQVAVAITVTLVTFGIYLLLRRGKL